MVEKPLITARTTLLPSLPSKDHGAGKALNLRGSVSLALAAGSCILYGCSAISMNFVNKLTLQIFGLANTLLLLQVPAAPALIMR